MIPIANPSLRTESKVIFFMNVKILVRGIVKKLSSYTKIMQTRTGTIELARMDHVKCNLSSVKIMQNSYSV